MNKTKHIVLIISLFVSSVLGIMIAEYDHQNYTISEDYSIKFSTRKAEGTFGGLTGTVDFDPQQHEKTRINVAVDVSTIKSGNTKKDAHARNSKWFDAERYPTISFTATNITQSEQSFVAEGNLTIKDVTKKVFIPFESTLAGSTLYLNGTFTIDRTDYNINGNLFGFAVGKDVDITLRVPSNFNS